MHAVQRGPRPHAHGVQEPVVGPHERARVRDPGRTDADDHTVRGVDGEELTGIVVDRVQEVLDIAGEDIEKAPEFGSSVDTDFILGMGKIGESVKILLDIDAVLGTDSLGDIS